IPLAQSSTLKPAGTLILSTGISLAAFGAGGCGMGASAESASEDGWPCFHVGGAWADAHDTTATTATTRATATNLRDRMVNLPFENRTRRRCETYVRAEVQSSNVGV